VKSGIEYWEDNIPPKGDGTTGEKCNIKDVANMTEVDFLENDDEDGNIPFNPITGKEIQSRKQGKLYAFFPTEKAFSVCLPTKEIGLDLLNDFLKELDKSTGMVKYLVELGECWEILVGMSFASVFISLFYIYLLRCITKPLLYTSMLLILILFVLCGAWCWMKKSDYDPVFEENNYKAA